MAVLGIPILDNLYPATMDMWPIEAKEFNRIWPFYENLKQGRFTTQQSARIVAMWHIHQGSSAHSVIRGA
jgi:hypothetical protein